MASLKEFDDITISDFLKKQPEGYLDFFTPFSFTKIALKKELENSFFVLIFIREILVSFSFARYHPEYESPTIGYVTDYNYQNKGLAQLGLSYLKSYCKLHNLNSNFAAHINKENKSSLILAEKSGVKLLG